MSGAPIFLCGFMGCGKSTVGKILARMLKTQCLDLDDYIEKKEGMTIPEIFEQKGEPYFRSAETQALKDLSSKLMVVATGGGALLSEENAAVAKAAGLVVFIDTPFEVCYERIKDDPHRPIAASSTKEQLSERFSQRRPLYLVHSNCVISGELGAAEIAKQAEKIYVQR